MAFSHSKGKKEGEVKEMTVNEEINTEINMISNVFNACSQEKQDKLNNNTKGREINISNGLLLTGARDY